MNSQRFCAFGRFFIFSGLLAVALTAFIGVRPASAEKVIVPKGWEEGGPYDQNYNPRELDKLRAWVVALREDAPMKGMAPGVILEVKEGKDDDETILVHVCPSAYMGPGEIGLRRGDRIKIRGAWAYIDNKDVFMAAKIKKGDYFELKVRLTTNGKPFWTMTPEELARERSAS